MRSASETMIPSGLLAVGLRRQAGAFMAAVTADQRVSS
jgi:hypothetical protein